MQININKTQQNIAVLGKKMKYPKHIRSLPPGIFHPSKDLAL